VNLLRNGSARPESKMSAQVTLMLGGAYPSSPMKPLKSDALT
jgi:hypothetical protein